MSEQILCTLGKNPKTFSYIDQGSKSYIEITCKLQEEITDDKLREFFKHLYSMKLDCGYSDSFDEQYNTKDLIACFTEILITDKIMNLNTLYSIINKKEKANCIPLCYAILEFFTLFEIISKVNYTLEEYYTILRQQNINPLFSKDNDILEQEEDSIQANSKVVNFAKRKELILKRFIKANKP